ncbi:MAG: hypothetical protein IPK62_17145 [Bacteroidetes bacterium]|nr:hypothetical protein [Bacteroidota bacterium]
MQNENILKKIVVAESELGKEMAANAVRLQQLNTANKNAAREMLANEGSVNKMSASLIKLRLQWDAMSDSLRKSPLGLEIQKRIQATDAALKQLDGSTGRFQRNVGDYKNQLHGLTQVFRELPGFTYSAQTGILGLSNNLPILADNFKSVANATNEVTGKVNGTMGALKIFGASIFSFGNIFAIAIGLFTIFSKEIFAMFESTEKLNKSEQDLIQTRKEANKQMNTEISHAKVLLDVVNNLNLSVEDRSKAYDELNKVYPDLLSNMSKENVMANGLNDTYFSMLNIISILALKKAQMSELEKLVSQQVGIQNDINAMTNPKPGTFAYFTNDQLSAKQGQLSMINDKIQSITNSMEQMALIERESFVLGGVKKGGGTSASGKTKDNIGKGTKEDRAKEIEEYEHDLFQLDLEVQQMNEKTDEATKKRILDRLEWIRKKNEEYAKMELDAIKEGMAGNQALLDSEDAQIEEMWRKRIERVQEYANIVSTATELMGNITEIIYNAEISKINERERVLNDNYDAETKRINASFTNKADRERELIKLQAQREAQQKNIDQARRRAERKAAQQNKAYNIAEIIMNTANAVMKTFAEYGYTPLGIGLAAAQGAIGIANIARVASTPLPEYYKGTDNHPGGLAHVGEKGVELGILPGGKTFLTPATDTIMDLPAQTKIIPHEKLMQSVYNVAFKKLGNGNKVSTDSMQTAMLEAFSELTNDVKELKKVMINKNSNVNIIGNFDHYMHVKKNIR